MSSKGGSVWNDYEFNPASAQNRFDLNTPNQFINAYYMLSYIGFAASLRAGAIAKTDFRIENYKGEEILGTKVESLLRNPGGGLSQYLFFKTIGLHKFLDGNVFLLKMQDNAYSLIDGKPSRMHIVSPANVEIIDDNGIRVQATTSHAGMEIKSYDVRLGASMYQMSPDKIIHINSGSPVNLLRGMGEIQQNVNLLEADKLQDMFNKAFFQGGAISNLLMQPKDGTDILDKDLQRLADDFRQKYGKNKESIMFGIPGFEAKPLDINYRQLQFIELKNLTKEDIMMFARIPRSMYGAENQYVSKDEDKIAFEEAIDDDYVVIEDSLSKFIQEFEGREDLYFTFIRANTKAIKNQLELVRTGIGNGFITPAEARDLIGLPIDENASNEYYLPLNLIQADEPRSSSEPAKMINEKRLDIKASRIRIMGKSKRARAGIEDRMFGVIKEYYRGLEKRLISHIEKSINNKELDINKFDWVKEDHEARIAAKKLFTSGITLGINATNEIFGSAVDPTDFNTIKLVVDKLGIRYATETLNSRRDEFKKLVADSLNEGQGAGEIKGRIQEVFDEDFTGPNAWKSRRIARTEASNAYNQANALGFESLGVTHVDIVGCLDNDIMPGEVYGCNSLGIPIEVFPSVNFHPNHTGTAIPAA